MAGLRKYKSLYSSTSNSFATGEAVTITPASVVGLPSGNIVLTFDRVNSSGTATPSNMERILGSISGGNFVVASGGRGYDGTTEQSHTSPVVEMIWNAADWNDTVDALTNVVVVGTGAVDTTKVVTPGGTQTLTNKTLTSPVLTTPQINDTSCDHQYIVSVCELAADRTVALPLLTANDEFVFKAHTQTLTNKRTTKRITAIESNANPTINTDNCDVVDITAQAADIASMTTNLSGTPTNFQTLIIRFKDNGTARAITWGASYEARGVALPTTTVISKVLTVGFLYDTTTSKWGCVASTQEV